MPQTGNIASALCLGEQLADFGPGKQTEIPWISSLIAHVDLGKLIIWVGRMVCWNVRYA